MVEISLEFKEKIDRRIKNRISPKRGSSRKLLETGGRKCVTLDPGWCDQWELEKGSKVLIFIDEDGRLIITPATEYWKKEMGENYDISERKIVNVGNSLAVTIPSNLLKGELRWEKKKLLRSSDYTTVYEPYDPETQEKIKRGKIEPEKIIGQEEKGLKKDKYIALALVSIILIGAVGATVFILTPGKEKSYTLDMGGEGTYENTVLIKNGLQISPAFFLEENAESWTFEKPENTCTEVGWDNWYTHGTGSTAIGGIKGSPVFLKPKEEIIGIRKIDLSNIDTLLIDIYGRRIFPNRSGSILDDYLPQEVLIGNDVKFRRKNDNFEKIGFKIDATDYGENEIIAIRLKNNWGGIAVAPLLAIDGLRSEKLKSKSGKLELDWQKVNLDKEWEEVTIDAEIPENTQGEIKITSSKNGVTTKGSKTLQIEDGTKNYDISELNGNYVKAEISLKTENIRKTSKIYSIKINP